MAQSGNSTRQQGETMGKKKKPILKELRVAKGLTQPQAAEQLECGLRTLCAWEAGERVPGGKNLSKLAALYGVTMEEILG